MTTDELIKALSHAGAVEAVAIGMMLEESDDQSKDMVLAMLCEIEDWAKWAREQLKNNLDHMEDACEAETKPGLPRRKSQGERPVRGDGRESDRGRRPPPSGQRKHRKP